MSHPPVRTSRREANRWIIALIIDELARKRQSVFEQNSPPRFLLSHQDQQPIERFACPTEVVFRLLLRGQDEGFTDIGKIILDVVALELRDQLPGQFSLAGTYFEDTQFPFATFQGIGEQSGQKQFVGFRTRYRYGIRIALVEEVGRTVREQDADSLDFTGQRLVVVAGAMIDKPDQSPKLGKVPGQGLSRFFRGSDGLIALGMNPRSIIARVWSWSIRLAYPRAEKMVVLGRDMIDLIRDRPDDDALVALLLGPTGNLRAPTIKAGRTMLVGFDPEMYAAAFG